MSEELVGIVTDCQNLNIRNVSNLDADVICTVQALSELMIDVNESTDEFYKVYTAAGVEGYCVRKYVAIKR